MSYEGTAEPIKIGHLMDFTLPPACPKGFLATGPRVSFGKWTRRAWMGAGYLVARTLDADGVNSRLVDRFGQEG